jgi:hypothetical protein
MVSATNEDAARLRLQVRVQLPSISTFRMPHLIGCYAVSALCFFRTRSARSGSSTECYIRAADWPCRRGTHIS